MVDRFKRTQHGRYPDAPGHRGVQTSIDAAEALAPKLGRLQRLTLDAIAARAALGLTFEEAAELVGIDFRSIQPRVSELKTKGLVADSGLRRFNASRKRAIVWVTPEHRREAAPAQHDRGTLESEGG